MLVTRSDFAGAGVAQKQAPLVINNVMRFGRPDWIVSRRVPAVTPSSPSRRR